MKIISVKFSAESVRLTLENGKLILPLESAYLSYKADSEIDEFTFSRLSEVSDDYSAYLCALRFLRNMHSSEEVRKKITSRGFSKKTADKVLKKLVERKYINDHDFALRMAENLKKRSYGTRYAENKLRQKGVDASTASSAVKEIFDCASCEDSMLNLLIKKYRTFDRAKCGRFLFSRGFSPDSVYRALKNFENYLKEETNESQRS